MNSPSTITYPGGSKERVRKAGNAVRSGNATIEDFRVIEEWRAAHRPVINTFQAILRIRTKGQSIVVAQRHKRRNTIFGKLQRHSSMQLHRMDDVAGCRMIFDNIQLLYQFREKFHKAKFRHRLRNEIDRYDYIKNPKPHTGYRGIHDVYEYDVNSNAGARYKGLYIEIQYRTRFQHAWATTVEVIGFITEHQPKFDSGDDRYRLILQLSSEIISRAHENMPSSMSELKDEDVVSKFLDLDKELGFMSLLRGLNSEQKKSSDYKNMILIFSEGRALEVRHFRDATDALRELFELERRSPEQDIVLVRADTTEDVRVAFKNYFSDATEFIQLIDSGCEKLSHKKVMRPDKKPRVRERPARFT